MVQNFYSRYEVIANLVERISSGKEDLLDPLINTLEKNFDRFFDNLETIAEKYADIKRLPTKEMWDSRSKVEQIASAYRGIESIYLQDLVNSLEDYYDSYEDDVKKEVYKNYRVPEINRFSDEHAKKYVLSFEVNEKYRHSKVYSLIFGDSSGKGKEDRDSIEI